MPIRLSTALFAWFTFWLCPLARGEPAGEVEQRLQAVCERVTPAIVHIIGASDIMGQPHYTALIVTADGLVLMPAHLANRELTVELGDGRRTTARSLGWSREWGVALARLDGAGPWPFVEPGAAPELRAGMPLVTFAWALHESSIVSRPLVDLEWVDRCAPGLWFMRPDAAKFEWKRGSLAFDLEGRLAGIESITFLEHGTAFTHAALIQSLWDDLAAGGNVDEQRLKPDVEPEATAAGERAAEISRDVEERAVAATVQLRREAGRKGLSGVIVSPEGLIATVAHHFYLPGEPIVVSLPDGRDLPGEIVGSSLPGDIGLARITASGEFPHVESGDSISLRPGDSCLAVGYGPVDAEARRPEVRRTNVVEPLTGQFSHLLPTDPATPFHGGDCGGGIFDAAGRLVAIANPHLGLPWPHEHGRVEMLRRQWDQLQAPFDWAGEPQLAPVAAALRRTGDMARRSIVEVLDGDTIVALGTVAAEGGLVLTKASLLPEAVNCRAFDGRVWPASLVRTLREHDLAVLRVNADLPAIVWSDRTDAAVGALVVFGGPDTAPGTLAHPPLAYPPERGTLRAGFRAGDLGPVVSGLLEDDLYVDGSAGDFGAQTLQPGDTLLGINGRPTRTPGDIQGLLDIKGPDPVGVVGDRVRLDVLRDGRREELRLNLGPAAWPRPSGQSARCSGFPRVLGVTTSSEFRLCGGPVLDRDGRAVGVAVTMRQTGWVLVVPAAVICELALE